MDTTYARVVVVGASNANYNETTAAEDILPGAIVNSTAAGLLENNDLIPADGASSVPVDVAVENDIFGGGVRTPYKTGETVIHQHLKSGCEFMALVAPAAAAIAKGAFITSAAGGFVSLGTEAKAFGKALEAVDNSAGTETVRIRVRVI